MSSSGRSSFHHFRFLSHPSLHGQRGRKRERLEGMARTPVEVSTLDQFLRGWPRQRTLVDEGWRTPAKGCGGQSFGAGWPGFEKLFVGGTDVWVGVGRAPEGRPKDEDGGRGRSAPTYASYESIPLRFNPGRAPTSFEAQPRLVGGKKRKKGGEEDRFKTWKIELSLSPIFSSILVQQRFGEGWATLGKQVPKRERVFGVGIKFSPRNKVRRRRGMIRSTFLTF